jgi:hypothetical protein
MPCILVGIANPMRVLYSTYFWATGIFLSLWIAGARIILLHPVFFPPVSDEWKYPMCYVRNHTDNRSHMLCCNGPLSTSMITESYHKKLRDGTENTRVTQVHNDDGL